MSNKIVNHLAIILDGNGRWAQKRLKPRTYGHKKGMALILKTALSAIQSDIKYLTLYCFSTENWNRSSDEIEYLMEFPTQEFNSKKIKEYNDHDIKVEWLGRRNKVPQKTREALEEVCEKTKNNKKLILNIALDYGSFEELETSIKKIVLLVENAKIKTEDITKELILSNLYTSNLPPVDLMIRTGGEKRLSNFLLLQSSYAELYFTKTYWPDFKNKELQKALNEYSNRDRRFGRIK